MAAALRRKFRESLGPHWTNFWIRYWTPSMTGGVLTNVSSHSSIYHRYIGHFFTFSLLQMHLIHWRIWGGGAAGTCPPTGSISFVFTYVFAKKCTHQRLAPPNGLAPPQWEILDPPLLFSFDG